MKLVQLETAKLILHYFWPPNSPDLNPVDYHSAMGHGAGLCVSGSTSRSETVLD